MWPILVSLFFSLLSVSLSVYSFLSLSAKASKSEIESGLKKASDDIERASEHRLKMIETEWNDQYLKFQKIIGRIDRAKAIEKPNETSTEVPQESRSRSDILRRGRAALNVKTRIPESD